MNIGTSKTRNLPLNRPSRVIVAASDEQKGQADVSAENGRADSLRDEIPDARGPNVDRMAEDNENGHRHLIG